MGKIIDLDALTLYDEKIKEVISENSVKNLNIENGGGILINSIRK